LPFARERGWQQLESILKTGHAVVTVNQFTADYIRQHNERVFIVNDSPQTEDFDRVRPTTKPAHSGTTLGWIGSPLTAGALFKIWEPLEDLFKKHEDLHLRLVGTGPPSFLNLPRFERVGWSAVQEYDQARMISEVFAMDIGLFPTFRGDDAMARGSQKASVYMSGEVAVVAQRYGENIEVIEDGVNGMLAGDSDEWVERISWLITHPDERAAIARRGLETVRRRFSRAATFAQLAHAIENV